MKPFFIGDLKIPVPIVQGGMGIGISLSGLASAVANAGGVGVIATVGVGFLSRPNGSNFRQHNIDVIRDEIRKARKLSSGVIGVNIMTVLTNFSDMVQTSIEEGIDIIFSGAGLPLDLPMYLKEGIKTKLVPIVSSARAAAIISDKWKQRYNYLPDAFVVEGPEAGGHLGFKARHLEKPENKLSNLLAGVLKLTAEIKERYQKDVPVIAGGGIFTGSDIHKIIEEGASAVQMGTRFIATPECDAAQEFKDAIINSTGEDIKIIESPVGLPGRTIFNEFLVESKEGLRKPKKCRFNCIKTCDPKTTSYCIADALIAAYKGDLDNGFVFAGSNAGRVTKMNTVAGLIKELSEEYKEAKLDR